MMNRRFKPWILVVLLCGLPFAGMPQRLPDPLSPKEMRQKAKGDAMVAALSHRLIAGHDSTEQRVEAIYDWVTHHIRFAKWNFKHRRLVSDEPYRTLKRRKALSLGYATLVEALCDKAGIPAFTVLGHARTVMTREGMLYYRGESAWNAVQIGGQWRLLDACWGQGPILKRKQRFRKRLFERFWIPYFPKYRIPHRPSRDWYLVPPDSMLRTHIPVDPKWQLLDSAMTLRDFEAVLDTAFPRLANDYASEIVKVETMTKAEAAVEEGKNARRFNPRDDFELARAHIRLGQEGLFKSPEAGGDTALWRTSVAEMRAGKQLLVEWYRKVGREHRGRKAELNKIRRTVNVAISQASGEMRLLEGEVGNHRKFRRRVQRLTENEILTLRTVKSKIAGFGRIPREAPKPIKPELKARLVAKEQEGLARIGVAVDTIDSRVRSLHRAMTQHFFTTDSIEGHRQRIADRIYENLRIIVSYREKRFLWGNDTLKTLTRASLGMRRNRLRQSSQFWVQARALPGRSVQTLRQYEAVHGVLRNLYRKGLPLDSVQVRLKMLNDSYATWEEKRRRQIGVADVQFDVEWQHLRTSMNILGPCEEILGWKTWCNRAFWKREWRKQLKVFKANMRLAKHLHLRADQGIQTMQRWIRDARIAAKRR